MNKPNEADPISISTTPDMALQAPAQYVRGIRLTALEEIRTAWHWLYDSTKLRNTALWIVLVVAIGGALRAFFLSQVGYPPA